MIICPDCKGEGVVPDPFDASTEPGRVTCRMCNGTGLIEVWPDAPAPGTPVDPEWT